MNAYQKALGDAEQRGHRLEPDPPHELSSVSRRTCSVCGRAVLGNVTWAYGSALEVDCQKGGSS